MQLSIDRRFFLEDKTWVSFAVGAAVGIIPATKGLPSISLLLISLLYLWQKRDRLSLKYPIPILQYLVIQFILVAWHAGEVFAVDIQSYYILLFFAVPIIYFFLDDFEISSSSAVSGIIFGLFICAGLIAYDYYTQWNGRACRAPAFQYNVLRGAIQFVALASICTAVLTKRGQFGWLAAALIGLMFLLTGPFMGARMSFYTVFMVVGCLGLYFIVKRFYAAAVKLSLAVVASFSLSVFVDTASSCDFFARVTNSMQVISDMMPRGETLAPNGVESAAAEGTEPAIGGLEKQPETGIEQVISKPAESADASSAYRAILWRGAMKSFVENPWFGTGAANETNAVNFFVTDNHFPNSHNQYLSWAVSGGILGLLSAFLFCSTLFLISTDKYLGFMFMMPWAAGSLTLSSLAGSGTFSEFLVTLIVVLHTIGVKNGRWIFVFKPKSSQIPSGE